MKLIMIALRGLVVIVELWIWDRFTDITMWLLRYAHRRKVNSLNQEEFNFWVGVARRLARLNKRIMKRIDRLEKIVERL
jgi:hypothetical protein